MKTSIKISNIRLENPTILAAGILGVTASSMVRVANEGAGAVTTKSIGPEKRGGHENPVIVELDYGLLNAIGLSCPEPDEAIKELKKAIRLIDKPVIASFFARTISEFGYMAELISEAKPAFLEVNISCPNVGEFGKPFGCNIRTAGKITRIVRNSTEIPIIVKLTPNVVDIKLIAKEVEDNGADVISAINTLGPGMKIDIISGKPILSNKFGGMSGQCIKPIAVRCVYEIYDVVDIPIIGIGGVKSGEDAIEMMMAGASAVGIGTGIWNKGIGIFKEIVSEIEEFMSANNYKDLKEIIGKAHN
ncbi:MAG: dihydroorotate dehydrogenase [Candidatus Altiarchaeales archaeon]|nr:MAG: dihydroorotate dehydrogenase [Candidatus Altiarchaeales archaeon]